MTQPSPHPNANKPSPAKVANPKRQKNDWYKKSPSPEPQDPDWNTVKTIDDAQEQHAFAMNCLGLTTLTREVLVGPVFNLLKGYDHPDMGKPLPLIEKEVNQQPEFSQPDSGLIVLVFQRGNDPIDAINHVMSFLTAVVNSRYPTTNNQPRNSSNPRQQATINDGRVTLQPIQGRQTSFVAGEGHMSKQCTKPKRKRDDSWFKEKVLLVQAQAHGQILNKEELAFLADSDIPEGQAVITHNATYQADDLDAYHSDCDKLNTAKVSLMANLSHCGLDALVEVHNHDNMNNNMLNKLCR
ncbi:hypothetical protein Tco_0599768 [Tanacetum coccineum]